MVMEMTFNFDIYTKKYFSVLFKKWHFKDKSESSFVWLMFPNVINTHTHTHIYIYIYILLHTACAGLCNREGRPRGLSDFKENIFIKDKE